MSFLVRAFPLRQSLAAFNAFVGELQGARRADTDAFYQAYGVEHESWHVQQTDHGPWVIVVTLLASAQQAAPQYAQANDAFASWFKGNVLALSGVDPSVAPLGPPTTEVFHWSATPAIAQTFAS